MASLVITNLTSSPVYLRDLYTTVAASGSVTTTRSASDLANMSGLQELVADGVVSVAYTRSADEVASGLDAPPVIDGVDLAAVAAAAVVSSSAVLRFSFTAGVAGTADDVTVFAVNALPFKFRVVDCWAFVATAVGASTWAVRTAAAGAGTLLATLDSGTTGRKQMTGTATALATPGASAGLFVRRSDRGTAGEVFVLVRKEA